MSAKNNLKYLYVITQIYVTTKVLMKTIIDLFSADARFIIFVKAFF